MKKSRTFSYAPGGIKQADNLETMTLNEFLKGVKTGIFKGKSYVNEIAKVRSFSNTKEGKKNCEPFKSKLPYVSLSGTFYPSRASANLVYHSGLCQIDLDDIENIEQAKETLKSDKYTLSLFLSPRGYGIKIIVQIPPVKSDGEHQEYSRALESYYKETYGFPPDKGVKDVARAFYISYDVDLYTNKNAEIFTLPEAVEKPKVKKQPENLPVPRETSKRNINEEVEVYVSEIERTGIDITGGNGEWFRLAVAFAKEFNESGRDYFRRISVFYDRFNETECNKMYTHALKNGRVVEIGHFIRRCWEFGIKPVLPKRYSEQNHKPMPEPTKNKKNVFDAPEEPLREEKKEYVNVFDQVKKFLVEDKKAKRNEVTGFIELNGESLTEKKVNSLYIEAHKVIKKITKTDFETFINSDELPPYNPFKDFFDRYEADYKDKTGYIENLINSLYIKTGFYGREDLTKKDAYYASIFIKKWLIGLVASCFDRNHNPLMIVLIGKPNCGKSWFFRYLLPNELLPYFANNKLSEGKDSEALMCEKLLILNDELATASKYEAQNFRNFVSADQYTYRPPYAKMNITRSRLASVCATSNDMNIIQDAENNRRIVPIQIDAIAFDKYNATDKIGVLMEAYQLYKEGVDWNVTQEDIKLLAKNSLDHRIETTETELIQAAFRLPEDSDINTIYLNSSEVAARLKMRYNLNINPNNIGKSLSKLGFEQVSKKTNGIPVKKWKLFEII